MSKRRIFIFVQWSVSIILIWYLLSKIEFKDSINSLKNVNAMVLLISIMQLAIQPLLGALRWKIIINALGGEIRFVTALRLVWIGTFFSQALPGAVGGDVARIWLYLREGSGKRMAINSVAIERLIMVLSLFILVAAIQPGLVARSGSVMAIWLPPLMLLAAICGLAVLMLSDRIANRFSRWLPFRAISYLAVDARKTLLAPGKMFTVTLVSILAYLNMAITAWLIAVALNLTVSLSDCFVLIPVVLLAATIPISVGGWGVREGTMTVLFGTVGVSSTDALALSVLFGIAGILVSLPGLAIWLSGGYRRSDIARDLAVTDDKNQKE